MDEQTRDFLMMFTFPLWTIMAFIVLRGLVLICTGS